MYPQRYLYTTLENNFLLISGLTIKPISASILFYIIAIFILLGFAALISAAESAFFSLAPSDMEELKSSNEKKDATILELIASPKRILATLVLSINFINIAIIILSTVVIDGIFDFGGNKTLSFIIQVVAVTFLILLIGEVSPKVYATHNPLKASRRLAYIALILQKLFYPVSSFLMYTTSLIDRAIKPMTHNISVDELSQALELTADEDLPEDDHKILKGIVTFGNTSVKQIMKSRLDVTGFEYNTTYTQLLKKLTESGFSRVPIYKEKLDDVAGILYTKDLLQYIDESDNFNWQNFLRPAFFVPENKKIDDLLREFQTKKTHMAIVVDEYGGTSGIVTLEDVIEEIVGDINDEFDDDDLIYSKLDDDNFIFEGKTNLTNVFRILDVDASEFDDVKGEAFTLAGLIIEKEGRIPERNEKIELKNLLFTIESADRRKIKRVKITVTRDEPETKE